jgi:hypothetical protein
MAVQAMCKEVVDGDAMMLSEKDEKGIDQHLAPQIRPKFGRFADSFPKDTLPFTRIL